MRFLIAAGILAYLLTRKTAPPSPPTAATPLPAPGRVIETGTASFYGPGYDGKPTASGEAFDRTLMTAAHRTLKFGTKVRVTDLDNGSSVVVRVNDRGPFHKDASGAFDRCIDLSEGAASVIGLDIRKGLARVRLDLA